MNRFTFEIGDPYQKLDQEPADRYDSDIETLERLVDEHYDDVSDVASNLTPRTNHEIFRTEYVGEEPAMVSTDHVNEIVDVLDDLSEESRNPVSQRLFELGYRWRDPFIDLERVIETPYMNHPNDNLPEHPDILFGNPFAEGKEKREEDKYYSMAIGRMMEEISDWDVEIR